MYRNRWQSISSWVVAQNVSLDSFLLSVLESQQKYQRQRENTHQNTKNKRYIHDYLQKFSFPKMENRQFKFSPKIPYDLVAERSEATSKTLPNSDWLHTLNEIRTHFRQTPDEWSRPAAAR